VEDLEVAPTIPTLRVDRVRLVKATTAVTTVLEVTPQQAAVAKVPLAASEVLPTIREAMVEPVGPG